MALAAGGVGPEARAIVEGEGSDFVAEAAILSCHTETFSKRRHEGAAVHGGCEDEESKLVRGHHRARVRA